MSEGGNKKLRVTMPDGSVWEVPVARIIQNRADYYFRAYGPHSESPEYQDYSDARHETTVLFRDDEFAIKDWAENNMDWEDVAPFAVCTKAADVDYQEGWVNGKKEIVG